MGKTSYQKKSKALNDKITAAQKDIKETNMKKIIKIILLSLASVIGVLILAFVIYLIMNIQGKAESFEINTPKAKYALLIATQGSPFKDALLNSFIEEVKSDSLYIKVIDVGELDTQKLTGWNGIILIHTVERFDMQKDVSRFLNSANDLSNILLVTTSGSGEWQTDKFDVDAITSASKKEDIPNIVSRIKEKFIFLND